MIVGCLCYSLVGLIMGLLCGYIQFLLLDVDLLSVICWDNSVGGIIRNEYLLSVWIFISVQIVGSLVWLVKGWLFGVDIVLFDLVYLVILFVLLVV